MSVSFITMQQVGARYLISLAAGRSALAAAPQPTRERSMEKCDAGTRGTFNRNSQNDALSALMDEYKSGRSRVPGIGSARGG